MRYIIPISGKDSLATALVQLKLQPELNYEYVFNPTGAELPCVFEWLDKVSLYLGKPITCVGRNLLELIEDYNYFLPSRLARYCTRECKIEPFEKWIGVDDCTVYYGIRADENRGGYQNAGARGVTVCDRWRSSIVHFIEDMGLCPNPKLSLDRINNDGNYEKDNCRWANDSQQSNNRRSNLVFQFNGERKTLTEISKEVGIKYDILWSRLRLGFSIERAISQRIIKRKK